VTEIIAAALRVSIISIGGRRCMDDGIACRTRGAPQTQGEVASREFEVSVTWGKLHHI
jgi:hypothetical protein